MGEWESAKVCVRCMKILPIKIISCLFFSSNSLSFGAMAIMLCAELTHASTARTTASESGHKLRSRLHCSRCRLTPSCATVCKSWCSTNANAWEQKCTWMTTCGGCSECSRGCCLMNCEIMEQNNTADTAQSIAAISHHRTHDCICRRCSPSCSPQ